MSNVEAVIFDAGGVLHESNTAVTDDLVTELGIERETLRTIWKNQIARLGTGDIDETDFWSQVRDEHGIREVNVTENLLGRAFREFLTPQIPIIGLVKELGAKGVKLAVLSNTIEPHAKALHEAGLYDGFDFLFLSHELGMRKPDPAIYRYVLSKLNVLPQSTLFVDDDPKNVQAAEMMGINGIVFSDTETVVSEIRSRVFGI